MKRAPLFFLVLLVTFFLACQEKKASTTSESEAPLLSEPDTISIPKDYTILATAEGNLNKDSIPEKVVVYDTARETDFGTEREIHIFQKQDNSWQLWHKSIGAVLPSEHGGMMGDPFEGFGIENGVLVFNHFGGSRGKWRYIHRFRYQNQRWELIGATTIVFTPCEMFQELDYNLSTGNIIVKHTVEDCENEEAQDVETVENFVIKLEKLPTMDGFYPGGNEVDVADSSAREGFYF